MAMRQFLRDSALYGVANLIARGMVFLLLPLYTQILTRVEVGAFEWLSAASLTLMSLLPLEITQSLARLRTQGLSDDEIQNHARSAFGFTVLVFTGFAALVIGLAGTGVFLPDQVLSGGLLTAAVTLLLTNALLYFLQNELRWSNRVDRYTMSSIVAALVTAVSAVVFLAVFQFGLIGLYAAMILGSVSGVCVALRHLAYLRHARLRRAELMPMLRFSLPLAVSSVTIILATTVDRLLVAHFLAMDALGLYGVAIRIAAIAMLAFQGFQLAVLPATVGQGSSGDREAQLERSFRVFLLIAMCVALLLSSTAPWILGLLVAPGYQNAQIYIPVILVGTVAYAASPFAPGLWLKGNSWAMAVLGLGLVATGGVLSWVLIPLADVMGAALAYALTSVVYGGAMFWVSDRVFPVGRRYGKLLLAFFLFVSASACLAWMAVLFWAVPWRMMVALLVVGPVVLLLTDAQERRQLGKWIRGYLPWRRSKL